MFESFTTRGRVRNALKLLSDEREVIVKGPLIDLPRIVARRDKLMRVLVTEKAALTEVEIGAVRGAIECNQNLLQASLSGMRAAKTLLADQHRAATTMGTYTDSGERLDAPQSSDVGGRIV